MMQKMGPLAADHLLVEGRQVNIGEWHYDRCPACKYRFKAGDYVTLIAVGPGGDHEERAKCLAGRPYNAVAIPVHFACATGDET